MTLYQSHSTSLSIFPFPLPVLLETLGAALGAAEVVEELVEEPVNFLTLVLKIGSVFFRILRLIGILFVGFLRGGCSRRGVTGEP